jgi:hypothetical protein
MAASPESPDGQPVELLTDVAFAPEIDTILSSLRMDPASDRGREVRRMAAAVGPILKPKAAYDVSYVEGRGDDTVTLGGRTFTSRVLRVNLDEVGRVFPFVATCGREVYEAGLSYEDPILNYCLDRVLEEALGAALARLEKHLKERYGLGRTSMMNPGSLEDWPLSQQQELFALLGDVRGAIGVELTDSFLMVPMKSVSGMIFPTEIRFESCQLCPRKVCPKRRARYDPELWERKYGKPGG